jgi:hypothetical protein
MEIMCNVMPSFYRGKGQFGDWQWMKDQTVFAHTLFVFNDNEEQFVAYLAGTEYGYSVGAGNALARPWRQLNPPKSAGVPIEKNGAGYQQFDKATKEKIDQSLTIIYDLLKTFYYDYLVFSTDETGKTIGTSTFEVDEQVLQYIFDRLTQSPQEWKKFIEERTLFKFRQFTHALKKAQEIDGPHKNSTAHVGQLRHELHTVMRICRK